jgi:hypothetical protein
MAYVSEHPVACSLTGREQAERAAEARDLIDEALVSREVTEHGLRLRFRGASETRAAVRDLVRREKECCPFFDFEIAEAGSEFTMMVSAPSEARPLLESLFRQPREASGPRAIA